MRNDEVTVYERPALSWRFVASGLWIRLAFAGAAIAALGVVMLVSGDGGALVSLGALLAGIGLVALGYRQASASLEAIDTPPAARPGVAPIRSPQTRLDLGFHPKG